jgi:broad specificity phosphatase PhoE
MLNLPLSMGGPMQPIILVRHGQAESNLGNLTGGWSQTALTEVGHRQARLVAGRLKAELGDLDCAFYHSDLLRAAQTAEIVAEETGLKMVPEPGLREINNGVATGKTQEEAKAYYREPTRPLLDWRAYPGGETWREYYTRVSRCMDGLTRNLERPLLIVAHGGTVVNAVAWWLRIPLDALSDISFPTNNTGITILVETGLGERAVERHNDVSHLHAEGIGPPFPLEP